MARLSKQKRKQYPDERDDIGPFRFERYGRLTVQESFVSERDIDEIKKRQIEGYRDILTEIETIIDRIVCIVDKLEPLELLTSSYFFCANIAIKNKSEADLTFDEGISKRMLDYIQSIMISLPWEHSSTTNCTEEIFNKLFDEVKKLFNITTLYYHIGRSATISSVNKQLKSESHNLQVSSEMQWNVVTGKRYINHSKLFFEQFLIPHNNIFVDLFGISAREFIEGIEKIRYSLMNRAFDSFNEMNNLRLEALPIIESKFATSNNKSFEEVFGEVLLEQDFKERGKKLIGEIAGYDLFDVKIITNFPDKLLEHLALAPGLNTEFFHPGAACGWPLRKYPVNDYPFLKVDDTFYCFDIVNLMDHLYRVMQKIILKEDPTYQQTWNKKQDKASQAFVVQLLKKVYPKALVYESNHYQWKTGKTNKLNWCENDLLVVNDDLLLVVEIKGGSYTPSSPSLDFGSHHESIKGLLLAPVLQARRTFDYLRSAEKVKIFQKDSSSPYVEKTDICLNDFRKVILCTVSLDSLLSVYSQEMELKFMKTQDSEEPVWSLSIDDLMVYTDILDGEIEFTHFIEQRIKAIKSPNFAAEDELDYLGLYLKENHFTTYAEQITSTRPISWLGYRTPLDEYYSDLLNPDLTPQKPSQNLPMRIKELVSLCNKLGKKNHLRLGSYLLDSNGETRTAVHNAIQEIIERQNVNKRIFPFSSFGNVKITIFCITPSLGTQSPSEQWIVDYTIGALLSSNDDERLMLVLYYDEQASLFNVEHRFIHKDSISKDSMAYYEGISKKYALSKVQTQLRKGKIGRNEKCPCGSNKKFKYCHGLE